MPESKPLLLDSRPPLPGFAKFRESKLSAKVSQYADIALRYLPMLPLLVGATTPAIVEIFEAHESELEVLEHLLELTRTISRITVVVETPETSSTFVFRE